MISGCAAPRPVSRVGGRSLDEQARTFAGIYRRAKQAGFSTPEGMLQMAPDLGEEPPYVPVYTPPRVVKVWVPAHVAESDRRVMVAGHWTFLVVEEPHWALSPDGALSRDDPPEIDVPFVVPGLPAATATEKS